MMVAVRYLRADYGHFTAKQDYEKVLNNAVMLPTVYEVRWLLLIRIMQDTGSRDGGNVNYYLWLN
jgi:hypothetical protein